MIEHTVLIKVAMRHHRLSVLTKGTDEHAQTPQAGQVRQGDHTGRASPQEGGASKPPEQVVLHSELTTTKSTIEAT